MRAIYTLGRAGPGRGQRSAAAAQRSAAQRISGDSLDRTGLYQSNQQHTGIPSPALQNKNVMNFADTVALSLILTSGCYIYIYAGYKVLPEVHVFFVLSLLIIYDSQFREENHEVAQTH